MKRCSGLLAIICLSNVTIPTLGNPPTASTTKRIVLIATKLDHPAGTHMYADVCRMLVTCLNHTPGVKASMSPDFDWPKDETLLRNVDAIVYYSRPAGDIVLSPAHRKRFESLLRRGIGFTAIHWATAAELDVGPRYEEILGAWFNFAFCGLKVETSRLMQLSPEHPVCRGWQEYDIRDEFYLKMKFSGKAKPVLKVRIDNVDQPVAWILHRDDGGRSFGTTLGHFQENYSLTPFRRMLVNGILWTAGVDVPDAGADVRLEDSVGSLRE